MIQPAAIFDRADYAHNYLMIYEDKPDSTLRGYAAGYKSAGTFKKVLMALNPFVDFGLRAEVAEKIILQRAKESDLTDKF